MKHISDGELRFLEHRKMKRDTFGPIANAEEIAIEVGFCYIIAEKESDKEQAAWLLYNMQEKYRAYLRSLGLELGEEYERLVKKRTDNLVERNLVSQKRRHERRDDFALTKEEWAEAITYFNNACAYCLSDEKLTYDHFNPFSKGGPFTKANIIPCCSRCNSSKNDNEFKTWYKKQSFYCERQEDRILKYIEGEEVGAM